MPDRPIEMSAWGRLSPRLAVALAGILLLLGLGLAAQTEMGRRAQRAEEAAVQAGILATTSTAALAFDDRKAAAEYVRALSLNPEIRGVAIYDNAGNLFASFARDPAARFPAKRPGPDFAEKVTDRIATVPVAQGGTVLGTVYLRQIVDTPLQRVQRYLRVALLIGLAALVLVVFAMAQAALGRANRELVERAAALAQSNRQLKAQIEERERAQAALRQAQKMETIGQLTGGIAHDFNNLLTIILGNLDRLRRHLRPSGVEADRAIATAIDNAVYGAERAAALTKSLLAFARRQPLSPKPTDVNDLIASMSDLLDRALGAQVAVRTQLADDAWPVLADPNQLENAILNLAVNARDAMPSGGTLTIATENVAGGERAGEPASEFVRVSVADTGIGMTKEVLAQAFEPFFTTKGVGRGTGLGLSQVYGFVQQSEGRVEIDSEPGRGTTVSLHLPRSREAVANAETPATVRSEATPRFSGAVLVVEDEAHVRDHSVDILHALGFRISEAADGPTALEVLGAQPEITLLFTDIGLPGGMTGRELAEAARSLRPDLRVLFTSGYAQDAAFPDGLPAGDQLLPKPFTETELRMAVQRVLDAAPPAARADIPAQAEAVPRRALVVEDEVLVRMMAVDFLTMLGFEAVEAGTAQAGIDEVRRLDGALAVAVIDIGLPDRPGDTLAAEIRATHADLPIVIASGYTQSELAQRFAADPHVGFVQKPFDHRRLAAALARAGVPGDPS